MQTDQLKRREFITLLGGAAAGMAARGARAAAGYAGDRIPRQQIVRWHDKPSCFIVR